MRTHNLADLYDLPPLEWSSITERLDRDITQAPDTGGPNRHTCWLTTLDADGAPHTTGVGAEWLDGSWWFETGRGTRKGRNVERDPRCTLAVALHEFDLVVQRHRLGGDRPGDGGPAGRDLGRRRLAVPGRRVRHRADRGVQRTVGRQAAVARLPDHSGLGGGAVHRRARRRDPVRLLSRQGASPTRLGGTRLSSETPELRSAEVSPSTLSENGSES